MTRTLIRYRTHPDRADDNQRAIEAVFAELRATPVPGLDYQVLRLPDATFLHLVTMAPGAEDGAITKLAAFREFQRGLAERCLEPPQRCTLTLVGAHVG